MRNQNRSGARRLHGSTENKNGPSCQSPPAKKDFFFRLGRGRDGGASGKPRGYFDDLPSGATMMSRRREGLMGILERFGLACFT